MAYLNATMKSVLYILSVLSKVLGAGWLNLIVGRDDTVM